KPTNFRTAEERIFGVGDRDAREVSAMRRKITLIFLLWQVGVVGLVRADGYGSAATTPMAPEERPVVMLGRPQPLAQTVPDQPDSSRLLDRELTQTSFQSPEPIANAGAQSAPIPGSVVQVQAPLSGALPPTPAEQYNCGVVTQEKPGFW